jgi:hypothetical protein
LDSADDLLWRCEELAEAFGWTGPLQEARTLHAQLFEQQGRLEQAVSMRYKIDQQAVSSWLIEAAGSDAAGRPAVPAPGVAAASSAAAVSRSRPPSGLSAVSGRSQTRSLHASLAYGSPSEFGVSAIGEAPAVVTMSTIRPRYYRDAMRLPPAKAQMLGKSPPLVAARREPGDSPVESRHERLRKLRRRRQGTHAPAIR